MAKQTIIVMSDSHGDRSIVEAIKEKYLGQVDGIFHNGDSELKVMILSGKGSTLSKEIWIFMMAIRTLGDPTRANTDHPDPRTSFPDQF